MASDGIRLSVDKGNHDTKFILEAINHHTFRGQAERFSIGSTRKRISLKSLRFFFLIVPSLPEQQKIASILTSVDEQIEQKQQKLTQTQSLKTALMQDLLTGTVRVEVDA